MSILITGAGGLIGSVIADYLSLKQSVITTARQEIPQNARHVLCDLSLENAPSHFASLSFDTIVHCAATFPCVGNPRNLGEISEVNRKIDENILRLAKEKSARVIYMSSIAVYAQVGQAPLHEGSEPIKANDYALEKLWMERELLTAPNGLNSVFRISSPFGFGQKTYNVLKIFVDRASCGLPLLYYGEGSRTQNFIDSRDIATAIEKCAVSQTPEVYNIANRSSISMKEMAETVARSAEKVYNINVSVTSSGFADAQENWRIDVDISKAKEKIGWLPVYSLERGIEDWMKRESLRG